MKYTTEASRNRNSCEYQNEKKKSRCDTKKANDTRHLERNTNLSICVFGYCLFAAQNIDEIKKTVQQKIWRLNTSLQPYWFCRFVNGQFWAKAQTPFHRKVSSHWGFRHLLRVFFMFCGFLFSNYFVDQ